MPSFVNGVRSEFTVSDIEYSRDGGWFLSYRKAALLTILVMCLCLFSAYMGRQSSDQIVYVHVPSESSPESTPAPEEDKVISEIVFVAEDGAKVEIKTVEDPTASKFTKLPQEVAPLHYDLHFVFAENPDHHTFKVMVNVTIQPLVDGLEEIVMHAKSLEFDDNIKMIDTQGNKTVKVNLDEVGLRGETIKLKLDEPISRSDKYILMFHITGNIGQSTWGSGVFRSNYTEEVNDTQYIMMTKFDPTGARQAFPCFDEPIHKTTFNVSVTHSKKYSCLFNTPKTHNFTDGKNEAMTVTTFTTTPRMSTYLLSFFIGNTTAKTANVTLPHQKRPLAVHIWRRPSMADEFGYLLEIVPDILHHFAVTFDTPLPLAKVDLVVVPGFNVSAVENWGLIYLRESDCKVDELSSFELKRTLFIMVGHNLAHHWLGDLVTFNNWTSVWFYESLAITSVDDALVKTDLAKSWPNEELKFVQRKAFALHADSLYNTRSVLNNSEESVMSGDLYSRLGSLTYSKGVFILDMLRSAISEHAYTKAVQSYLKSWNTANANEMDFAETLNGVLDKPMVWASNSTRKNLTHVMRNWVSNEGFPVLHVTRDEKKRDHLKFRQEWFHYEIPKGVSSDDDESQWYIPVTLTTLTNTDFNDTARFWLDRREYKYRAHGLEEDAWVIVNLNFGGFYRVNYDLPNWSLLTKEIHRGSSSVLQPITQGQLMDDAFALARAGMLSYEVPLDMSKSLKDHWTYVTWMTVLNNVRYFKNILIHEKHSMIEEVLRKLTTAAYDQLSYELSLSYSEELLLSEISEWSCRLSVHTCVSKVNKTYHENGYDLIKAMHTDQMINTILCTVVRESNDKEFNILWESLNTTDDKYPILLKSLSCSKNQTKVFEVLDKILDESSTHLSALWSQLSSDPDTAVHMFTWFRDSWDSGIKEKVNDRSVLGKIVTGCTEGLTTTAQLLQLKKFLQNREEDDVIKELEAVFTSSIQIIESKISWRNKHSSLVNKWLRTYVENH